MAAKPEKLSTDTKLLKLKNKVGKPKSAIYFPLLMLIIVCVHMLDEICGIINNDMQSAVVKEFLVTPDKPYNEALSQFGALTTICGAFTIIAPFYKTLADRFGRKPFFFINTVGMALGLTLCWQSPNFAVYCIGYGMMSFFISHDMQVVYIYEVAPVDKRASFYGITKCIGTLGMAAVPLLRDSFMGGDETKWRNVYTIPVIFCFAVALVILVFARESDVFLNKRIDLMEKARRAQAQNVATPEAEKSDEQKIGVFPAVKYIFKNSDLRWLVISHTLYGFGFTSISSYYQSIMSEGYGMSVEDVTTALYFFPFVFAAIILVFGFFGDRFGRKKVVVINAATTIVSLILFNYTAYKGMSPYLVGLFCALSRGSYYNGYDYIAMMAAEKAPTQIRNSVLGAENLVAYLGTGLGMVTLIALFYFFEPIGLVCMSVSLPTLFVSMFMLWAKVKESKGADLASIS